MTETYGAAFLFLDAGILLPMEAPVQLEKRKPGRRERKYAFMLYTTQRTRYIVKQGGDPMRKRRAETCTGNPTAHTYIS